MNTPAYPPGQPWPGFLKAKREARKNIDKARREHIRAMRMKKEPPARKVMNPNRGDAVAADLGHPLRKSAPELFTISTKGIGKPRGWKGIKLSTKQRQEVEARKDRLCKEGAR